MNDIATPREQIVAKVYSAVLSDVLDAAGYRRQAMRPFIRPLDDSLVLFGRVRTGLYANSFHVDPKKNPYAVEMALVDDLQAGDVPVLACGGPTDRIAPWGELLSKASRGRGAAGCVTDGLVRDVRRIREMSFPVFHGGIGPLDSKGRGEMIARDVPIECGGVRAEFGDWIFGDADGVVIVPQPIASAIFAEAVRKVEAENQTRQDLLEGKSLAEVYDKYGVL
jgi:4-hydroxy-4-methyl-2-oxoglutarate aldolase